MQSGSDSLVRQRLQKCHTCSGYSLSTTCPKCGGSAQAAAPMKWSPEDHQAARRRQRLKVGENEWIESLPKPVNSISEEE